MREHGIASLILIVVASVVAAVIANVAFEGGAWVPFLSIAVPAVLVLASAFAIMVGNISFGSAFAGMVGMFFAIGVVGGFIAAIAADTTNIEHPAQYKSVLPWAAYGYAMASYVVGAVIHCIVEDS